MSLQDGIDAYRRRQQSAQAAPQDAQHAPQPAAHGLAAGAAAYARRRLTKTTQQGDTK